MRPIEPFALELERHYIDALAARDLKATAVTMRVTGSQWSRPGFDVTVSHILGNGATVTGSGKTLIDALTRATEAFDIHIRPHLKDPPRRPSPSPRRRSTPRSPSSSSSPSAPSPSPSTIALPGIDTPPRRSRKQARPTPTAP